jgi:hypothetical protein
MGRRLVSLNRFDAARDENEPEIVNYLRKHGVTVERLKTPGDLLCGLEGVNTLLEVKTGPREPLTEREAIFKAGWRGQHDVVWSGPMALQIVRGYSL